MGTWKEFVTTDGLFFNLWILSFAFCVSVLIIVIIAEFPASAESTASAFVVIQFGIYSLLWLLEPRLGLIQYTWDSMLAVGDAVIWQITRALGR